MKQKPGFTNSLKYRSLNDLQNESVDLFLAYCGYEECTSGHRYGPNQRKFYVLHVVTAGKGTFEVNNEVYHLGKDDAFLIPPGLECWYEADKENPWTYMWLGFLGLKAEECVIHSGFSKRNLIRKVSNTAKLYNLVNGMLEAYEVTYSNELVRTGLLNLFFAQLIDEYSKQFSQTEIKYSRSEIGYVKYAIAYISENYSSKIKINELADRIGVNRSYLASSFKKATGYSPKEYLLNLRMEKVKALLKETDLPINSISNAVGYTDQLAFSRMFKQYTGLSPKAYREEGKESTSLIVYKEKGEYKTTLL